MALSKKEKVNTAAYSIAKKLNKLASEVSAERLLFRMPENTLGLPCGEFILGPFLRYIAAALNDEIEV